MKIQHILSSCALSALLMGGLSSCVTKQAAETSAVPDNLKEYYAPREKVLGLPDFQSSRPNVLFARVQDKRQAYRMCSLKIPKDITPEWADAKAKELHDQGFNFILSEDCRYLMFDEADKPSPRFEKNRSLDKVIADSNIMIQACHKYGMDFIHHLTCTMVDAAVFIKHPTWKAINIKTGETDINGYGTANTCINNDDFWKTWFAALKRLLTEAPCDGIMIDEIQFFAQHLCGCDGCNSKFHAETGLEPPTIKNFGKWVNDDLDRYRRWLRWRVEKVNERHTECRALVRALDPDDTYSIYLCNNSSGYAYYAAGLEIGNYLPYGDSIGLECEPHDHSYIHYWPLMFFEMKYLRAVAEHTHNAFWVLYYTRSPADDIFSYFCGLCQGGRRWWLARQNDDGQGWKPLLQWEQERQNLLIDNHAYNDIAVLFSSQCRDQSPIESREWIKSFASTCNALTFHNTPYRVVIDRDLEDATELAHKASTLIAFDASNWNSKQISAVTSFVQNGGTLVTSGNVALTNPDYQRLDNFAIRPILGFDFDGNTKGEFTFVIKDGTFGAVGEKIAYNGPVTKLKNLDADVKVAAEFIDAQGNSYPALLIKETGKGKAAYFAGLPYNCYFYHFYNESIVVPGQKWEDKRNPQWGAFLNKLALFNVSTPVLKTDNIPSGVVVEAHRQAFGTGSSIQLHIANFLGAMTKDGIQPKLRELTFPPIAESLPDPTKPMSLTVLAPKAHSLYFFSPDFDEVVKWEFTRNGDYVTFTVPDFARYLIAYLAEGELDAIRELKRPIVTAMPAAKPMLVQTNPPLAGTYSPETPTVFSDTAAFEGGVRWRVWLQQEPILLLYGDMSNATTTTATIEVTSTITKPELVIGGMDDNNLVSHAPVKIEFEGEVVHNGPTDYPDNLWAVRAFPLSRSALPPGKYKVTITNTGHGPRGNIPWFAVSFIQLRSRQ